MEILKVQNLCKTYGTGEAKVDALKNVSFSLEKGEFVAVVGESGSGKSTLLNCIGALDVPTSGTVTMDGNNLFSMKEEERTIFRRRNIGFIFQSFQLVSELTVEQNICKLWCRFSFKRSRTWWSVSFTVYWRFGCSKSRLVSKI